MIPFRHVLAALALVLSASAGAADIPDIPDAPDPIPSPLTVGLHWLSGHTRGGYEAVTPNGKVNPDPTPSPLGLIPEHIRTQLNGKARVCEISEALHRYAEAGKPAPQLWTQELLRLLAKE